MYDVWRRKKPPADPSTRSPILSVAETGNFCYRYSGGHYHALRRKATDFLLARDGGESLFRLVSGCERGYLMPERMTLWTNWRGNSKKDISSGETARSVPAEMTEKFTPLSGEHDRMTQMRKNETMKIAATPKGRFPVAHRHGFLSSRGRRVSPDIHTNMLTASRSL